MEEFNAAIVLADQAAERPECLDAVLALPAESAPGNGQWQRLGAGANQFEQSIAGRPARLPGGVGAKLAKKPLPVDAAKTVREGGGVGQAENALVDAGAGHNDIEDVAFATLEEYLPAGDLGDWRQAAEPGVEVGFDITQVARVVSVDADLRHAGEGGEDDCRRGGR